MRIHRWHTKEDRLILSALLNAVTTAVQIAGGLLSGSLALLSDALHNLSDTAALVISAFAVRLSKRQSTEERTFGYKRAEILAAFFNAGVLVVVSFFLFKEAAHRLFHPHPVNSMLMLSVAFVGPVANIVSVLLLQPHKRADMNVRAAYLHLFSDFLASVAVILGACMIYFFDAYWVDPVLTILIGMYVLRGGYEIIGESVHILMQHVPEGISLKAVQVQIERMEGVKDIHHAHLWAVTERDIHFEAHVNTARDMTVSETCVVSKEIEEMLRERFGITHTTLQFEFNSCKGVSLIKQ